jgi:hypothetical protein
VTEFIRGVATGSGLGSFPGVVELTRDLFDAIEFDAACTGDHEAAAQQMSELAASGAQTDDFPRSEAFVRAVERPAEADTLIRQLEAEQPGDPRVCDLVAELLVECSDLPGALRWATAGVELCIGRGVDADQVANNAAEAAAERVLALPDSDRAELQLLLRLRYRVRNDLGLPEDGYDLLLDGLGGLNHEPAAAPDTG